MGEREEAAGEAAGEGAAVRLKYAVWIVADQTWAYFTAEGAITTKHSEAVLFGTRAEAEEFGKQMDGPDCPERCRSMVEQVPDEREFKSREDTW